MANININNLQATEIEFSELSDLELQTVVGGRRRWRRWIPSIPPIPTPTPPIPTPPLPIFNVVI